MKKDNKNLQAENMGSEAGENRKFNVYVPEEIKKTFSQKLKELRKERGLTQEKFADYFHVSKVAVSKWETGAIFPDIDNLFSICNFFSCDIDFMFGRMEEPSHMVKFISDATGLSVKAARLLTYKIGKRALSGKDEPTKYGEILTLILEHPKFAEMATYIERLVNTYSFYVYWNHSAKYDWDDLINDFENGGSVLLGDYLKIDDNALFDLLQYKAASLFSEILSDVTGTQDKLTNEQLMEIHDIGDDDKADFLRWVEEMRSEANEKKKGKNRSGRQKKGGKSMDSS